MNFALVTYREGGVSRLGAMLANDETTGNGADPVPGIILAPPELKRWASMLELLENWPAGRGAAGRPVARQLAAGGGRRAARPGHAAQGALRRGELSQARQGDGRRGARCRLAAVLFPQAAVHDGDGPRCSHRDPRPRAGAVRLGGRARRWSLASGGATSRSGGRWSMSPAYCVANDVTARGYHRRAAVPAEAFRFDWLAAKAADTSLPLGPGITPAFLVPDPQDLRLRLWVNGELQQDESTADMICGVDQLVATASTLRHARAWRRHRDRNALGSRRRPGPVPEARRRRDRRDRRPRPDIESRRRRGQELAK